MLEAFYLWIYTPRAHDDGTVAQLVEDALAFPHPQSGEDLQRQLDAFMTPDFNDRVEAFWRGVDGSTGGGRGG
jgi:hypothetical protein